MNVDTQNHLTVLRGMLAFELNEARAELRSLQRDDATSLSEAGLREPADRKDEAAAALEHEIADASIDRVVREIEQCERALARLDEGRYGDCVDCGEPIAWPRLMAQPAAERCADCQHAFENATRGGARGHAAGRPAGG